MADSEEDFRSEDSNISDDFEETSDTELSTSVSSGEHEEDYGVMLEGDGMPDNVFDMSYTSETSSIPSSQHQWHNENKNMTLEDKVKYHQDRQLTNTLLAELKQRQDDLLLARDALKLCRTTIGELKEAYSQTSTELKKAKDQHNVASLGLLERKLTAYQKEIEIEKLRELELGQDVTDKEIAVAESELMATDIENMQQKLEDSERTMKQYKQKQAMFRAQGQMRQLIDAQRIQQAQDKVKKNTDRGKKTIAKDERLVDMKLTNEAITRRKEMEANIQQQKLVQYESRMKSLLDLKKSVEKTKETLKAKHLLEEERQQKVMKIEQEIKSRATKAGANPQELLLKTKTKDLLDKQRREFDEKHKDRQLQIVSKLLAEDQRQEKRNKQLSQSHWQYQYDGAGLPSGKHDQKNKKRRAHTVRTRLEPLEKKMEQNMTEKDEEKPIEKDVIAKDESMMDCSKDTTTVLGPDIPGLWEDMDGVAVNTASVSITKMSKMEKDILNRTLNKLKSSVVTKQVVAGKEFKGDAFISKPAEIVFKDFQVGKSYKRKVQLTNVSYTVNYCRLVGISDHLKDFFSIFFEPPGPISAGLTCQMDIVFQPKINTDLSGQVELLSQTGPIYIPVKCFTKKCIVSVETSCVSFGTVCVGETVKKVVTIHNGGALPTPFEVVPLVQPGDIPTHHSQETIGITITGDQLNGAQDYDGKEHSGLHDTSHISMLSAVDLKHNGGGAAALQARSNMTRSSDDIMNEYGDMKPLDVPKITKTPDQKEGEGEGLKEESFKSIQSSGKKNKEKASSQVMTISEDIEEDKNEVDKPQAEAGGEAGDNGEVAVTFSESTEVLPTATNEDLYCIKIGAVSSGVLQPYSSFDIELVFSPVLPNEYSTSFKLEYSEATASNTPVIIDACGTGVALPVYVEKETMDFKICLTDMFYQDTITLHNRSVTPHNMVFTVPQSLQQYIEILPHHGLIQGQSAFAAQLKFQPMKSLLNTEYVDKGTGILRVPIDITITGQVIPVSFLMSACVTISEIEVTPSSVDFGPCTVYESVVSSISIRNRSCLPMDYGFIHLPKWLSVEPNDGFGTLLPHETLPVDIVFSPDKPKAYSVTLTCKTAINKDVQVSVTGKAVLPALVLSENDIAFAATPYGASSMAKVRVTNPRLSNMDSSVIQGEAPPQGTYMFQFKVPDNIPIKISPHTGSVAMGKSVEVAVTFSPVLDNDSIVKEATRLMVKAAQESKKREQETSSATSSVTSTNDQKKNQGNRLNAGKAQKSNSKGRVTPNNTKGRVTPNNTKGRVTPTPNNTVEKDLDSSSNDFKDISTTDPPKKGSEWWYRAYSKLLGNARKHSEQWSIPCYISDNKKSLRPEETLYLDITAPAIRPSLVIITDNGNSLVNFNQVAIGDHCNKTVTLMNISTTPLHLSASPLTTDGTFELRNSLRPLPPNAKHSLILRFSPNISGKWYETVKIFYDSSMYLELTLRGEGVDPGIRMSPEEVEELDWGHVMSGDKGSKTLELSNPSKLAVNYRLTLESLSANMIQKCTRNHSGQSPFNCVPFTGVLHPESNTEVVVEFSPDNPGRLFTDLLHIEISSKVVKTIKLRGYVWPNNMYIIGGLATHSEVSLMEPQCVPETTPPVILSMNYCLSSTDGNSSCGMQFEIGCIRTALVKKASGEFIIDPLQGLGSKCFTVEPMKSIVEAGTVKTVSINFTLPEEIKEKVIQANSTITIKGDSSSQHQLFIRVQLIN